MSTLRTLGSGVSAVCCDTASCQEIITVPSGSSALAARKHTGKLGWSTPGTTASTRGNPHAADYCPACTRERTERAKLCLLCPGGELFDLLGHSRVGHQAARALYQWDRTLTAERVACMSLAELRAVPHVGKVAATSIAAAVERNYGTHLPQKPSDSVRSVLHALEQSQRTIRRLVEEMPTDLPEPVSDDLRQLAGRVAKELHEAAFAVGRTAAHP